MERLADSELRAIVRRVVGRTLTEPPRPARERRAGVHVQTGIGLGSDGPSGRPTAEQARPTAPPVGDLVSARCLAAVPDGSEFAVPDGARVTALAEEEAWRRKIRLVSQTRRAAGGGPRRVAVGSDHGGFAAKHDVLAWLTELGHVPLDLGTHDENPVDYPDTARAVAEAVAAGRADLGICLDGAGIGSAMAAGKVRGVLAATCWNEASARNAREHNFANVLAVGARMLERGQLSAIVRAFLATPTGAERHARRVDKIRAIETQNAADETAGRR